MQLLWERKKKLEEIFTDTIDNEKIPKQMDILDQEFDDFIKYEVLLKIFDRVDVINKINFENS